MFIFQQMFAVQKRLIMQLTCTYVAGHRSVRTPNLFDPRLISRPYVIALDLTYKVGNLQQFSRNMTIRIKLQIQAPPASWLFADFQKLSKCAVWDHSYYYPEPNAF